MLRKVTFQSKELAKEINAHVGKSYGFMERLKLGGIGSPRYEIIQSDDKIRKLLAIDNSIDYCNIELRKSGVALYFRSRVDTYGLFIPYYQLTIFKTDGMVTVYGGNYNVRVKMAYNRKLQTAFFDKMMSQKYKFLEQFGSVA